MWLVSRSAQMNVVGVEPKGSKCNLKNLECKYGGAIVFSSCMIALRFFSPGEDECLCDGHLVTLNVCLKRLQLLPLSTQRYARRKDRSWS